MSPEPSEIPLPFPPPGRGHSSDECGANLEDVMAGLKLRSRGHKKKSKLHVAANEEAAIREAKERRPDKPKKASKSKQERNRSRKVSHETIVEVLGPATKDEETTKDQIPTTMNLKKIKLPDSKPSTCYIAPPIVVKIKARNGQSTTGEDR